MKAASTTPEQDMLRIARCVCDVLVIPGDVLPFEGQAWRSGGRAFITICSPARDAALARIVAHELAHHVLGHTRDWTSAPIWWREYEAEAHALDMVAPLLDADSLGALRDDSRAYVRRCLQQTLDAGIVTHGEIDIGLELGCEIDPELLAAHRQELARRAEAPDDAEIPF